MKYFLLLIALLFSGLVKADSPKAYFSMESELSGVSLNIDGKILQRNFFGEYEGLDEILKNNPEALSEYKTSLKLVERGNWIFWGSILSIFLIHGDDSNATTYFLVATGGMTYGLLEIVRANYHFYKSINVYNGVLGPKLTYTWTF